VGQVSPIGPPSWLLLLGGRSEIGLAVARGLVSAGTQTVVLAARRANDLHDEESALRAAGATCIERFEFDADDLYTHAPLLDEVTGRHGPLELVVVAFGVLGDQARAEHDAAHAVAVLHTNYVAHVALLTLVAERLREQGSGRVVVFSSVAGVRVRRANYVYGSTKAALDGFASGLADSLHGTGASLLLVRPGFVVGRMTAGMSPAPLSSTPQQVADAVLDALRRGRGEVWVPPALRWVFAGMRLLPRAVWRKMPR
jgi:short-subunit dehydrogenase